MDNLQNKYDILAKKCQDLLDENEELKTRSLFFVVSSKVVMMLLHADGMVRQRIGEAISQCVPMNGGRKYATRRCISAQSAQTGILQGHFILNSR